MDLTTIWTEFSIWFATVNPELNHLVRNNPFWEWILGVGFSGFIFVIWKRLFPKNKQEEPKLWSEDQRHRLLTRIAADVKTRRALGLHKEVVAELKLKFQFTQVKPQLKLVGASQDEQVLDAGTTIVDVYDDSTVNQKLLILGNPGAGKTTVLLELVAHLTEKALHNSSDPVPVVFECSTWNGKDDVETWLVQEMNRLFKLKIEHAKRLLDHGAILILLDGLDELNLGQQTKFVAQLNKLLLDKRPLVICSRIKEYELIRKTLPLELNNAVKIEPLEESSIFAYLKKVQCSDLIPLLRQHEKLMELVQSPLFLNILILVKDQLQEIPHGDAKAYRKLLLDQFLIHRLKNKTLNVSTEKNQTWLKWLATHLKSTTRTEFFLEDIQPTMLKDPAHFGLLFTLFLMLCGGLLGGVAEWLGFFHPYRLTTGLTSEVREWLERWLIQGLAGGIAGGFFCGLFFHSDCFLYNRSAKKNRLAFGLAVGLAVGLAGGQTLGLALGLAGGLAFGLLASFWDLESPKIKAVELVRFPNWNSGNDWKILAFGLAGGLAFGLAVGLAVGLAGGLALGLALGLAGGLAGGLAVGLDALSQPIAVKAFPNQGIKWSGLNGLIFAVVIGPTSLLLGYWIVPNPSLLAAILGLPFALFIAFGGRPYIEHYCLRFLLAHRGYLPFRYVRFLNAMHEQKILQRVGGSYRFLHLTLRDHLAEEGVSHVDERRE